jgi:class 3 adenylate cyclase
MAEQNIESIDLEDFLGAGEALGAAACEELSLDEFMPCEPTGPEAQKADEAGPMDSEELKARIASYYINEQLRDNILRYGKIPESPSESVIGIGFVDIADYTYLSNWLSPKENQKFLNGLYTAFHEVLKRRGGFLNKISGDSMMFHFGGIIDPAVDRVAEGEALPRIAEMLFETCVEIQRTCREFNKADSSFLSKSSSGASRRALEEAFIIIRNLRENLSMVSSLNSMFQVRIRIGASIGEVCVGNFGPEGARQWDVIGFPVIEARRMESTAPIDGIRISARFYDELERAGLADSYLEFFRASAQGRFKHIEKSELFSSRTVVLYDKKDACFNSFAVQANPNLPQDIREQADAFLEKQEDGADSIVELLKTYRGNRLVIDELEDLFKERGIVLRKARMIRKLLPRNYAEAVKAYGSEESADAHFDAGLSLTKIFRVLGRFQDRIKAPGMLNGGNPPFAGFDDYMRRSETRLKIALENHRKLRNQRLAFDYYLFPYVFASIKGSILEYQAKAFGSEKAGKGL